jgi:two-component system response regulator FixJ
MTLPEATVFVVDDDDAMRKSLERLMESVGLPVESSASAEEFLESYDPAQPGCLLLDIRMPGMDGLQLQEMLASRGVNIPTIIISGHGDVEKAVRAMKSGALDFIKKPYKGEVLLARIREALKLDAQLRLEKAERADVVARMDRLTPRERELVVMFAAGKTAKRIAFELGLSRKTVDVHRGHIMMKLQADSLVDLARMAGSLRDDHKDV